MNTILPSTRQLVLAGAATLPLMFASGRAHAAFTLELTQSGGDVVVNGSGTINTSALTLLSAVYGPAEIVASAAVLFAGPATATNGSWYGGGGLTGPTSFGFGNLTFADAGTGSFAGIYGLNSYLLLPQGYTSGAPLTDSATFEAATFASLGFDPGTYVYTWGSGADADSLTVTSVVPEPGSWALLSVGVLALSFAVRHRASGI